jgi:hypothetical protein
MMEAGRRSLHDGIVEKGGSSMTSEKERMTVKGQFPAGSACRAGDLWNPIAHERQAWKRLPAQTEESNYGGSR